MSVFDKNDWDSVKANLIKGLTNEKKDIVNGILRSQESYLKKSSKPLTEEEEADEIIRRLQQGIRPDEDFDKILMPMIRRVMPSTITNEIVGVQPMSTPTDEAGKIYTLKYRYKDVE